MVDWIPRVNEKKRKIDRAFSGSRTDLRKSMEKDGFRDGSMLESTKIVNPEGKKSTASQATRIVVV